jgi:hypothetical protein
VYLERSAVSELTDVLEIPNNNNNNNNNVFALAVKVCTVSFYHHKRTLNVHNVCETSDTDGFIMSKCMVYIR